ncbi:unnamed protein product [Calypogeia fissa]
MIVGAGERKDRVFAKSDGREGVQQQVVTQVSGSTRSHEGAFEDERREESPKRNRARVPDCPLAQGACFDRGSSRDDGDLLDYTSITDVIEGCSAVFLTIPPCDSLNGLPHYLVSDDPIVSTS